MNAARADAETRMTSADRVLEFGLFRWSSGAGLCETTDSAINERWGAFIVIAADSIASEYHNLHGATVYCGKESI